MKIKRVYMLKAENRDSAAARLDKLRDFADRGHMPDGVSVRAYTSRDDDALIVETWGLTAQIMKKRLHRSLPISLLKSGRKGLRELQQ